MLQYLDEVSYIGYAARARNLKRLASGAKFIQDPHTGKFAGSKGLGFAEFAATKLGRTGAKSRLSVLRKNLQLRKAGKQAIKTMPGNKVTGKTIENKARKSLRLPKKLRDKVKKRIQKEGINLNEVLANRTPASNRKVAFDIDGITLKTNENIFEVWNKENPGFEIKRSDWTQYDPFKVISKHANKRWGGQKSPMTAEQFLGKNFVKNVIVGKKKVPDPDDFDGVLWKVLARTDIKEMPGMGGAIKKLKTHTGQDPLFITARMPHHANAAALNIQRTLKSKLIDVKNFSPTSDKSKIPHLKSKGITDYLEDKPAAWGEMLDNGINVHTIDQPWTGKAAKEFNNARAKEGKSGRVIVHKSMDQAIDFIMAM